MDKWIDRIIEDYNFAKEKGFDSIVLNIQTSGGEYSIYEIENSLGSDTIDEIIDVTEDYNAIQKEAYEYYKKANKSNSKKREHELRKQGHQISELLDWWLTTESLHSSYDEY